MHPTARLVAHATHYFFYFLIIVIPLSGWLMVSASSLGNGTLFFGLFEWPNVPFLADLPRADKRPMHEMFEAVHVFLAWSAVVLIPVHVAAALYHQFLRRDDVLRRMIPGTRIGATP
jgi:cytochrome b561